MTSHPYLLFMTGGARYGIAASVVQELFLLPALTPIAEAAATTVGIVNWRGRIVPVLDLNRRLGKGRSPYTLDHSVVLITIAGQSVGLIVNQVENVEFIAEADVAVDLSGHLVSKMEGALTAGLAHHNGHLITLLNPEALMQGTMTQLGDRLETAQAASGTEADSNEFLAAFSASEQGVLKQRADALMIQSVADTAVGLNALAIIGLQGERFAIGLEVIQEFTGITQITPIPCCPAHVVGNMNLRGEILTLVDIRQFLHLDSSIPASQKKAVIVRVEQIVVGLIVDDVFDVVYLKPTDIAAVPTAIRTTENEYVRGVAQAQATVISILDLLKLLTHGELAVDHVA